MAVKAEIATIAQLAYGTNVSALIVGLVFLSIGCRGWFKVSILRFLKATALFVLFATSIPISPMLAASFLIEKLSRIAPSASNSWAYISVSDSFACIVYHVFSLMLPDAFSKTVLFL